jgi:hypothetical protein
MPCPRVKYCPLFPELRSTLEIWRSVYCDDEKKWETCERYLLAVQGAAVPTTLLPNGKNLPALPKK